MTEKKDHCTWFPETWIAWSKKTAFKKVDISECCKIHDESCSTHKFLKCLRSKKIVGGLLITLGGLIGCAVKYPFKMMGRV